MDWFDLILALALAGLFTAILLWPSRRSDRLSRVLVVALPVISVVIVLDLIAISIDFQDADGIVDCWPNCSPWQEVIGKSLWFGGLLIILLALGVVVRGIARFVLRRSR